MQNGLTAALEIDEHLLGLRTTPVEEVVHFLMPMLSECLEGSGVTKVTDK